MSPSKTRKRSTGAPVFSASCATSVRARSVNAGCTSRRKRAPSRARRSTSRPAMKPGKPVRKIVSSSAKPLTPPESREQLFNITDGLPQALLARALDRLERAALRAQLFGENLMHPFAHVLAVAHAVLFEGRVDVRQEI